jgi:dCTP deaminase
MQLVDWQIRQLCLDVKPPMITPFSETRQEGGVVSYGLTSAGYDVRLHPEVWVFKNTYGQTIDPKQFKDEDYIKKAFDTITRNIVHLPPHSYMLGRSFEYIHIPRHLKARCIGKSTYARCGLLINCTPMEPDWEGFLTIEIANLTPCHINVYTMEGIAQFEFEKLDAMVECSYKDKVGKYDKQTSVTPAKVKV